jgi:hypothetical protein
MKENLTAPNSEVLERLDALLNRDKAAALVQNDIVEKDIPLLTEIYQPQSAPPAQPAATGTGPNLSPDQIEQIVELLLPEMTRVMQDMLTQQIQPALETTLRHHLQSLAQQKLNL